MQTETDEQRRKRQEQRVVFDGIAERYDSSRQDYPAELVVAMLSTAETGPGASVLEIGCGTGQLTRQLADRRFDLTAIDIGSALITEARHRTSDPTVRFEVSAFEDSSDRGPFDLIVSATAFHWVDPDVGLAKAARLLRPGAWLALLSTGERYPEPLRTALRDLWLKYTRTGEWATGPSWVAELRETPLFGEVVERVDQRALRLPAEAVLSVECTRATFLSYSETDQEGFAAELRRLLGPSSYVELMQETLLGMAQLRS
jgi:ubiquinone/menaquinone biosynthesis C-methylase UbiE